MAINKTMHGMSLVALLVSVAIGAFLMAGAIQIFSVSKNTFNKIETNNHTQNNYRFLAHHFNTIVSQAGYGLARFQPDWTNDKLGQPAEQVPGWQFIGCYRDREHYDDPTQQTLPTNHTIVFPQIASTCSAQFETSDFSSIRFFGMEDTQNCRSPANEHFVEANLFESATATRKIGKIRNTACDKACSDDSSFSCGAVNKHTLYRRIYPYVSGTPSNVNTSSDSLTVLFRGDSAGTIRDCLNNVVPNNIVSSSTYSVKNGTLQCVAETPWKSTPSSPITLTENLSHMTVLYGEDLFGDGAVNRYVPIDFSFLDPHYIVSVQIALTFQDPVQTMPPITINLKQIEPLKKYLQTHEGSSFTPTLDGFLRLHLEGNKPEASITDGTTTWDCEPIGGIQDSCTKVFPVTAGNTYILNYANNKNDKALLEYTESAP